MDKPAPHHPAMRKLVGFLLRIPAVRSAETGEESVGSGIEDKSWWVKFQIDVGHPLAWRTVQELAHVLNMLAIQERLPTVFKPVSPPPYLNGGPEEFLSWVIEGDMDAMRPGSVADWLKSRLPDPVHEEDEWDIGDGDRDDE
jgi:hypothetical protein